MKRIVACTAAVLLSACSGSGSSSSAPLSFSVSSKAATSAPSDAGVVAGNIAIQQIRLNVGRLKLEGLPTALDAGPASLDAGLASVDAGLESEDSDGGEDLAESKEEGEVEVRQGPFVVVLDTKTLNGAVTKVFDTSVPPGTYHEFKFDIFPGPGLQGAGDGGVLQDASVIVDGTIGGTPFTFATSLVAHQKKEGTFVVGGSTANITLSVDPTGWFGTATAPLDPVKDRVAIERNIRRSLNVFQDDDADGHENHHRDHGGHD